MCFSALVEKDLQRLQKEYGYLLAPELWNRPDMPFKPDIPDVFPYDLAPVFVAGKKIAPMEYSAFPRSRFTSYNARDDNLHSQYWQNSYLRNHGFVSLNGFREWVTVPDLLKSGYFSTEDIQEQFAHLSSERKQRIVEAGKVYRLTPTEKKPIEQRKIMIEFVPKEGRFHTPVVCSFRKPYSGFAVVTRSPYKEVAASGHDRSPVVLGIEQCESWLQIQDQQEAQNLLRQAKSPGFACRFPDL